MKSKSCIAALLALFTLGMTTSCEDMFDIDSNRVVYDHEINTTADSVYSTLGVLQCVRKVADRYVILGEVRGDMAQVDEERTKASLQNLANFDFESENEYLNVRDYYAVINNCNYVLANMDASLSIGNQYVLMDEYVALLSIRAWTYLQLAINYGEIPYYTYPVISESDVDRAYAEGKKDIKYIAADLALQLEKYLDVPLPSFAGTAGSYPLPRLVLAELYLWSGEYELAKELYEDFFMRNTKAVLVASDDNGLEEQPGYVGFGGKFASWNGLTTGKKELKDYVTGISLLEILAQEENDFISGITMEVSSSEGLVSEVADLFVVGELLPSNSWKSLCSKQWVTYVDEKADIKTPKHWLTLGDMRKYAYLDKLTLKDEFGESESYDVYTKHSFLQIVFQRRTIACLRWAEAMNALAREQYAAAGNDSLALAEARGNAVNAFYLLKDAFKVFFPEGSEVWTRFERFHNNLKKTYIGVHARGAGDVAYDTTHYVLKPAAIAERLGKDVAEIESLNDTIEYIDELLIDELALESTLEGNRFGDLIRFAKRRKAWAEADGTGDGNYLDFLAGRVANRSGERNDSLYNVLSNSEELWYLPFK